MRVEKQVIQKLRSQCLKLKNREFQTHTDADLVPLARRVVYSNLETR